MRCEECVRAIEEYMDGELDERAVTRLNAHLAVCSTCASLCEKLRSEQEIYAHYQRDIEVRPGLWAAVRARMEKQKVDRASRSLIRLREWFIGTFGTPRFSLAFTVALMLIAMAITAGVMRFMHLRVNPSDREIASQTGNSNRGQLTHPRKTNEPGDSKEADLESKPGQEAIGEVAPVQDEGTRSKAPLGANGGYIKRADPKSRPSLYEPTAEELVREAEKKYLAAIAILSRDVQDLGSRLDPEALARFEEALTAIDRTIAETRHAVRQHPDDPVAVQHMLTAYAKKVEVLEEMRSF